MNVSPAADALALRATASAFDAQRGKLPVPGDPHRSPDAVTVARQISELGNMITGLGEEILSRSAGSSGAPRTARVITGIAAAIPPAGEASAALGEVAHQLSFLAQTEHLRDQPDAKDAREAVVRVIEDALANAGLSLLDAANSLHAASATVSPTSARIEAARRRTPTLLSSPEPPSLDVPTGTPPSVRAVRGR